MSRAATRRRSLVAAVLAVLAVGGTAVAVAASRSGDAPAADTSVAAQSTPAGAPSTGASSTGASSTGASSTGASSTAAPSAGATTGADDEGAAGSSAAPTAVGDGSAPSSGGGTPAAGRPADVAVLTTYSGWDPTASAVVTGGYVGDLVEEGGTCSLTLSRDGVVLTGESTATPDATSTSCGEVRVTGTELTTGSWEGVLRYSSPNAAGESAPFSVVVP